MREHAIAKVNPDMPDTIGRSARPGEEQQIPELQTVEIVQWCELSGHG